MRKRIQLILLTIAVATVILVTVMWCQRGPRIVGTLARTELAAVRKTLDDHTETALSAAKSIGGFNGLSEWFFELSDRKLVCLDIQNTNRVLAFYKTANPLEGRILVMDRSTNGWHISDTNNNWRFK